MAPVSSQDGGHLRHPFTRAFSTRTESSVVMAGLVPAIHALLCIQGVDARHKAGHDVDGLVQANWKPL
jgi:hypothetical protein